MIYKEEASFEKKGIFSSWQKMSLEMTTIDLLNTYNDDSWIGAARIFRSLATNTVGLLAVTLNTLSLVVLRKLPLCFTETTDLIISMLVVMDFCTGVYILVIENISLWTSIPDTWDHYCKVAYPTMAITQLGSTMVVVILSIDRFILVTKPLRYPAIVTKTKLKIAFLLFMIAPAFVAYYVSDSYFEIQTRYCRLLLSREKRPFLVVVMLILSSAILATVVTNLRILIVSFKIKARTAPAIENEERRNGRTTSTSSFRSTVARGGAELARALEVKALRTVLVLTLAQGIAWLPFFVRVIHNFVTLEKSTKVFEFMAYFMGYSSCWLDPIFYILLNPYFRKGVKGILRERST